NEKKDARQALEIVAETVGRENVELSLGYVGMIHSNFPINAVYQWSRGPEEAIVYVKLRDRAHVDVEKLKETLREKFHEGLPDVRASFEPADIINEVMSFGSPTPIEISVSGPNFGESRQYADKIHGELQKLVERGHLRDFQSGQAPDYPRI